MNNVVESQTDDVKIPSTEPIAITKPEPLSECDKVKLEAAHLGTSDKYLFDDISALV